MNKRLLNRRQFTTHGAAFGLSFSALSAASAQVRAQGVGTGAQPSSRHTVRLPDGTRVPAVGQGCWHLGQGRHPVAVEAEALRTGIGLGMTLLDTSGNYGGGRSEEFLSNVLAGERERIFLVSKVEAEEISGDGIARACAASLARLRTDYLDLYLLHAPVPRSDLAHVVTEFEQLRAARKIRAWGVSNFDTDLMKDLHRVPDGHRCTTNQVPYSLNSRRIERDLLSWCQQHNLPVMAYSPLGGDHNLVVADRTLARIAAKHGCAASAVALAWVTRSGNVIAIPESGSPEHVKENAGALSVTLTPEDLQNLNAAFPGPMGAS